MTKKTNCPRCGRPLDPDQPMNALSRYENETYICTRCGVLEAQETMVSEEVPNPHDLPRYCYHHNHNLGKPETVMISFGMGGFYRLEGPMKNIDYKELNNRIGVTEEQADMMIIGSMYGFDLPVLRRKA